MASVSTNCFYPRPVSGTRSLSGTQLLSVHFEVVNFCSQCISIYGSYCI